MERANVEKILRQIMTRTDTLKVKHSTLSEFLPSPRRPKGHAPEHHSVLAIRVNAKVFKHIT